MTTTAVHTALQAAGTGHPAYTQKFLSEPRTAQHARRMVTTALQTWGLDELIDTGELVVAELVANTVEHTDCRYLRVTVTRPETGLVRIAVLDRNTQEPTPRAASTTDESGRGLFLVAALSRRTGTDQIRDGKRVWGKSVWAELGTENP